MASQSPRRRACSRIGSSRAARCCCWSRGGAAAARGQAQGRAARARPRGRGRRLEVDARRRRRADRAHDAKKKLPTSRLERARELATALIDELAGRSDRPGRVRRRGVALPADRGPRGRDPVPRRPRARPICRRARTSPRCSACRAACCGPISTTTSAARGSGGAATAAIRCAARASIPRTRPGRTRCSSRRSSAARRS